MDFSPPLAVAMAVPVAAFGLGLLSAAACQRRRAPQQAEGESGDGELSSPRTSGRGSSVQVPTECYDEGESGPLSMRSSRASSILVRPGRMSNASRSSTISRSSTCVLLRRKSSVLDPAVIGVSHDLPLCPSAAPDQQLTAGILCHGCHLQADGWEEIVWGVPPAKLGRLPQAAQLAWDEKAVVLVFGTGASKSSDGRLEGQYTLDTLVERLDNLHDFQALRRIPLEPLKELLTRISIAEVQSRDTVEEVREGFRIFSEKGVSRGFLCSSPTHLPRCLACACKVQDTTDDDTPGAYHGEIYACPSETCYEGFTAGDVVVVEPPHRGDRDRALDYLPFHDMVKRSFRVPQANRERFLQEFDELLKSHGA